MYPQALAAQNDTSDALKLSASGSAVAMIATSDDTVVGAHVGLQAEYIPDVWVSVQVFDIGVSGNVDYLTGPSKAGWADVPGAQRVRAIRLDAAGSTCEAAIGQVNA